MYGAAVDNEEIPESPSPQNPEPPRNECFLKSVYWRKLCVVSLLVALLLFVFWKDYQTLFHPPMTDWCLGGENNVDCLSTHSANAHDSYFCNRYNCSQCLQYLSYDINSWTCLKADQMADPGVGVIVLLIFLTCVTPFLILGALNTCFLI